MVATVMSVVYVLNTLIPEDGENVIVDRIRRRNKWDNDDYVYRGLILKGLSNLLFDIYLNVESGKELWDFLEAKYMAEDASSKKFLVSNFTNYKMTDSKPVMEQYNELIGILVRFTQHKMNMDEALHVSCIIDKLPPSWKDFKHTLKHNKEELTLVGWAVICALRSPPGLNIINDNIASAFMSTSKLNNSILWHARLGHVYFKRMQDMSKDGLIPAFDMDTKKNKKYFVTFIDDAFRFCYVYLLHSKDEALDKFKVFKTEVELQQGSQIKRFRTDRGGEYMDTLYFQSVGIIYEMISPYTPQQNGISERKNRVLKEMVNSMLSYSGLSQGFWGEAMAVVRLPDPKVKTFGKRGIKCIFVGYAEYSKAFKFYVIEPNDSVLINSIIELRDAIFNDNRFTSVPRPSLRIPKGTEDIGGLVVPEKVTKEGTRDEVSDQQSYCFNVEDDSKTFDEAMNSQDVALWKEVINDEMDSIMGNKTWVLVDLPPAFLNGELDEEVYMNQPQGFIMPVNENKVCKLIKSIYGLKQAPNQCHQKFNEVILSNGYLLNQADKCVYSKFDESGKEVIIFLYVDDMLIFSTDQVQSHYIEKVLKKFNYFDCTPVGTPIDTSEKLMPNNGQAVSQLEYSRVIGCLMYAMTCTRPDIAFVVGKLSRYTSNLGTQHWQAIQRVLKYLKKTMDYRLIYIGYPLVLEGYTDASWISNTEDNSSTSGCVFLLGSGAIYWASKKQTCITSSTMESEFVALAAAGKEAEWLKNLLLEIPLWSKPIAPISICCDNVATLAKAYSQRMCLEPVEMEDEVVNFLMVNFFEKVLSRSINKKESPMYSNGLKGSILRTP
ncbi:zinc finger, CCHC-type containing protein [Tanacetum coccineum]